MGDHKKITHFFFHLLSTQEVIGVISQPPSQEVAQPVAQLNLHFWWTKNVCFFLNIYMGGGGVVKNAHTFFVTIFESRYFQLPV